MSPPAAVPAWLRDLPRAPEYRPTETEFADPIAFLSRVEREAAAYGICKVVPPYPRPSRRFVFAHLNRSLASASSAASNPASSRPESAAVFTTRHQELGTPRRGRPPPHVLKQVWQSGEQYTLEQFEAKSRSFSKNHLAGLPEPTPLEVESLFWKASSDRPIYIEYANDVPGSGFAAPAQSQRLKKRRREGDPVEEGEKGSGCRLSGSPWNLQAIARAPGSLTRFMPDDVPGVTSPMVYIGMLFSWFAWHVEDHELHSLNFLHTGAPKTWYAVPGDRAAEFEEVIRVHGYGGNPDRLASLAVLGEKTTLMSPEVLVACGVPCCRLVQYPGEFVVTFPRAYHVGFSHGFNCGEAANFATPQWLKFAKEAALRRAVMNYLPMLSHQQLLYLLAVSFVSRTSEMLSGIRNSRLRDRRKEERELLVKQEFLQDMISENKLLCSFLKKKSIDSVVLWEPELLPSSTVLNSCPSASKPPEKKSDDGCVIESHQSIKDSSSSDASAQSKSVSTNSKSSYATSASAGGKIHANVHDGDDLPFDLSIDSGSLTCVACGILGYPFMVILQPSSEALESISLVHRERCKLSRAEDKSSNVLPCHPDGNSGLGCSVFLSKPSMPVEQPCPASGMDHANLSNQNVHSQKDDASLGEIEFDGSRQKHGNSVCSCSSENTLHSCSIREKSENLPSNSLDSELSKQTGRGDFAAQAVESCDNTINWNTSCAFARPRIFCLQHALEIEELLEGKGGVHAFIICHSDYTKLKALAISIAEEIEFQFDCTDVSFLNASKSDLHLINISIDDEGYEEDGRDWTSQMGVNMKYYAKLRKESSGNQEQPPLSFWGLFSNPSPISVVPNLKWLCRKVRTPYKIVGFVSSSSATSTADKVNPEVTQTKVGPYGSVYEDADIKQRLQRCGLQQPSRLRDSDDIVHSCSEEDDHGRRRLVDIPIALAEYPMMHQVCEGPVNVSTCKDPICSSDSQDSPPLTVLPVEFTGEGGSMQSTELSNSSVSGKQFLDEIISVEGSLNCVSRDESLQVQQDQEVESGSTQLQVDTSCSAVKAIGLNSSSPRHESLRTDIQGALATATPGQGGKSFYAETNSFDILLGALAEESKVSDAPEKDEVGKASLTLMTLASNDRSADEVKEGTAAQMAKVDTDMGVTKYDQHVDGQNGFHLSDLVSRSIGRSNRTDVICYVRRKPKRKRESKANTSCSLGSFVRSPCESLRPRTTPPVVEEPETAEASVSAAKRGKRRKMGTFQCYIDGCDMTFETRAELKAHQRNICTDESCGKRFSSHKYLKRHQRVHSDLRPLKCPWDGCEMTFKWLWAQTEHLRAHTGERPYKCPDPDCGQTFRYVSDYSRHRKKFNHC